jgi:hypothetical protein
VGKSAFEYASRAVGHLEDALAKARQVEELTLEQRGPLTEDDARRVRELVGEVTEQAAYGVTAAMGARNRLPDSQHAELSERADLIRHLLDDHGGYPPGYEFTLRSTADIKREHARKHSELGYGRTGKEDT